MEASTIIGLLGVGAMLLVALLGGFWAVHSSINSKIDAISTSMSARIDTIKDAYVRRDDLIMHLDRIENAQEKMAEAQERFANMLDRGHEKLLSTIDSIASGTRKRLNNLEQRVAVIDNKPIQIHDEG